MLFVSQQFLNFFAVVFLVYWAIKPHRARMAWLLGASVVFYMSWNPWLILLILFSASVDFLAALALEKQTGQGVRRLILVGSISINLGLLAFFKYANFFLDNLHGLGNWLGFGGDARTLNIILPLGISFYTFETISYIVDVYRRRVKAERNLLNYALFILFFPHLIAGPIVRPADFLPQTRQPKRRNWNRAALGMRLILIGIAKKAVVADHLAVVVDPIFASPWDYDSAACWLGMVGYACQIYCDFSGYSDMAIGLAHLFGFKLRRNFNLPYLAASIAEFWHRWHISLSSWLRDYLYIPLGGSRHGAWNTNRNLLLTMVLGGLWHGASWNFVLWGALHGALLVLHRQISGRALTRQIPAVASIAITFLCVCVGWVFFRATSLSAAGAILQRVFWPTAANHLNAETSTLMLVLIVAVALEHLLRDRRWADRVFARLPAPVAGLAYGAAAVMVFLLMPEDGKGFIYFQF
ncbi:MBOAT family O-acyltransferase [Zavarzinella formosa]|uniref:MBOAT family O-acyltransferase n=1 Tax=Zavarzinella formosa TaxID=360055 RepID=UPI00031C349C|nr:MBOAT family protein [Zavarzinella formosa]